MFKRSLFVLGIGVILAYLAAGCTPLESQTSYHLVRVPYRIIWVRSRPGPAAAAGIC